VSLFLSFLLLVLYLKPFICVCRVTHGIGLPVSTYHVSEDHLLAFTGINNLSPSPVLDDYLKLFYYALVFTYRKDSSVHKASAFMQDLGKCRTLRVM
ncbi:hypothetical protein HAX54_009092, partial [Datura stramonium]|nr:hypothetical protein [Datura stramonium]